MYYLGPEAHIKFAVGPVGESIPTAVEFRRVKGEMELHGEFARPVLQVLDRYHPFRKSPPVSEQDAVDGEVCSASKMWFPAHRVVYVDGLPYGDVFAPQEESEDDTAEVEIDG